MNRNTRLEILATALGSLFAVAACTRTPWAIDRNRQRLEGLEFGMTKSEVMAVMGPPHKREAYQADDGSPIEVLVYETEYTDSGPVLDSAFTPVILKSGQVIGWGRNMYDRTIRFDVTVNAAPKAK